MHGTNLLRKEALLVVTIICCIQGWTLIGYDCETPGINITTIAIDKVAECSQEESDYSVKNWTVQIVQREDVKELFVRSCLVEIVRTIFHCGHLSHSSSVAGGIASYIHMIGPAECLEAHRTRTLTLYHHHIAKLLINGTTSASIVMFGGVGADGSCEGTTFVENGRTYTKVVVQGAVKITLTEGMAKTRLNADEIILPGGLVCPFLKGYCTDSIYGETIWTVVPMKYCGEMATLYEGSAQQVTDKKRQTSYVLVQDEDRVFALTLISETLICQRDGWQTEHPKIMVIPLNNKRPVGEKREVSSYNTDLLAYINSKLLYAEQVGRRQLQNLYIDTIYRRCQMHREILKNRLITAPLSPSAVGKLIKGEQGYIGRVLGEVLYLVKCTPRPAELRRSIHCYNELPVTVDNTTKFLSPVTHIILNHAEEIDCSPLTPPMFQINNRWIGFTPEPVNRDTPTILDPEKEDRVDFTPIHSISGGGLYTNAEVRLSQRLILFGAERKAVENVLLRRISGGVTDNQGLQTLQLFDQEELKKLATSSIRVLWGWFTDLGVCVSGLMGIYVIFQLLKYVLGVALNSWQIYRTVGCGVALAASLWDTLTLWVLHRNVIKKHHTTAEQGTLIQIENANRQNSGSPSAPEYHEVTETTRRPWSPSLKSHWTDRR